MPRRSIFWTFLVTGLAAFMVAMDNLVVTNALPVIRVDLGTGLEGLEWTVNAYTLTFAVLLLTGAALGDRYGRRRLLMIGLAVFTAASTAAALAPDVGVLIAARAVQGAGGALVAPLTLTLLAEVVPPARRGLAFGVWGATSGLGIALGPVIGGAVVESASWQWIFWINVPIGLALIPLAALLPESRGGAGRLDPAGVALATAGLFGVVFGLVRGGGHGWTSPTVLGALVTGGALMVAFLAWQARARYPMVPLTLFRSRGFAVGNAVALLMSFGVFGSVFLGAQFIQTVLGYSPLEAGLRTLPWTALPAVVAPLSGVLADRIGPRVVIAVALLLQAVGIGWLAVVSHPGVAYPALVPPFVFAGLGMGLYFAPAARVTLGFAPPHLAGVASGTANALRQLGTVLGVAVLGAIFAALGGYGSGRDFVAGLRPAQLVGAVTLLAAAGLALAIPARLPEPGAEVAPETAQPALATA
ncbi:DHA2 family efflux MFS transporter permease subunit [Rhizomonospora bruguierae]|uniref:DHA2 family efflux MFS transporter permease subunit n=1 Tax=Rhizomonospora bruguierae TaxID=1581705 RepID=UPI001BD0BFE5|nr:DHA2 family efflux MFS transporter permease subunit [Micromonospora sp. NBRC 107566]